MNADLKQWQVSGGGRGWLHLAVTAERSWTRGSRWRLY